MPSNRIGLYLENVFWLFFTYLLAPLFYFQIFLLHKKQNPSKILIIQPAKIGDMVCMTPIFREIKKQFPDSYLAVMITSKAWGILKNNPRLDEIILIEDFPGLDGKVRLIRKFREEKYDWAINFAPFSFYRALSFWALIPNRVTSTCRGAGEISGLFSVFNNHCLEYRRPNSILKHHFDLLKFMGIEAFSEEKEVFIKPEEERKALDFLGKNNFSVNDLLVGISVTSGLKIKQWETTKFASLADQLVEKLGAKVIFTGSQRDESRIEEVRQLMKGGNLSSAVDGAGIFELSELPALIAKMKLFIGVDCGPVYIADAVNVPSVVVAGLVDMRGQHPRSSYSKIVQKDVCTPCSFYFFSPRFCKKGDLRCFKEVSAEEVFDAASALINIKL